MKTRLREEMTPAQREELKLKALAMKGHGPWSNVEMLLAEVCDRLQWVRHSVLQAASEKGKSPFDPEPIPRPGVEPKKPRSQFIVPGAEGDEQAFGTDLNVVTEDRIAKLRLLRQMRGAPEG